jgi:hypothetical protein
MRVADQPDAQGKTLSKQHNHTKWEMKKELR